MPCYNATSSNASLQNNIGALLLYESSKSTECSITNNLELAKERFYASIASANQLPPAMTHIQRKNNNMTTTMDIDGLTWFHNKLLREKREHNPLPKLLKIEMTHGIPLGLEYIHFPMIVPTGCEVGSTLASVLNLACLMWAEDKNLNHVAEILSWCFQLKSYSSNHENGSESAPATCCGCSWCAWRKDHEPYVNVVSSKPTEHDSQWSNYTNLYLMAIAHNNMGIVHFCQNRAKSALKEFDQARRLVEELYNSSYYSPSRIKCSRPMRPSSLSAFHIDYLNLATLLNQTRSCIRLNDMARSSALIPKLSTMNFPSRDTTTTTMAQSSTPLCPQLQQGYKFLLHCAKFYTSGLFHQRQEHYQQALEDYNAMIAYIRKELGHNHIHVAAVLEKKANVLFEQRKCQTAMLSYLASLRIYENQSSSSKDPFTISRAADKVEDGDDRKKSRFWLERSRILYAIGRTLHDREEISDALSTYQQALRIREDQGSSGKGSESITILTNIARLHHMMGNLPAALSTNLQIIEEASELVGGGEAASRHDFVRNRYLVLGNLYVEMGKLDKAMEIFARVARGGHTTSLDDIDTSTYAVRAAERLSNLRRSIKQHAAAA